jgi:phage terminase small subunit
LILAALPNDKWEAFAYSVAKGMSLRDSYVHAGYKDSYSGASRLAKQPEIAARIEELRSKMQGAALALVKNPSPNNIKRLADMDLTLDWCSQQFKEIAEEARIAGQFAAANTAIKNIQSIIELNGKDTTEDKASKEEQISVSSTLQLLDKMAEIVQLQPNEPEMVDITPEKDDSVTVLPHIPDLSDVDNPS